MKGTTFHWTETAVTEKPRQNEIAAMNIINTFWLSQVKRVAEAAVKSGSCVQMYPPTADDYTRCEAMLTILTTPPTSELSLAVPEKKSRKK